MKKDDYVLAGALALAAVLAILALRQRQDDFVNAIYGRTP